MYCCQRVLVDLFDYELCFNIYFTGNDLAIALLSKPLISWQIDCININLEQRNYMFLSLYHWLGVYVITIDCKYKNKAPYPETFLKCFQRILIVTRY